MTKAAILLLGACLLAAADAARFTPWHQLEASGYDFESYVAEYGKEYGPRGGAEWLRRRDIFEANLSEIIKHNKNEEATWKRGVNAKTDLTHEEFRASSMGLVRRRSRAGPRHPKARDFVSTTAPADLPASVDWRTKGALTPVKDQGQCGSCWTFAATEAIESAWFLKTGQLVELSEQQIASCTKNPEQCGGSGGCHGGTCELAFQQVIDAGGIVSEYGYAYASYQGQDYACRLNASSMGGFKAHVDHYVVLPPNQYWPLLEAVATVGPIAVTVDAGAWGSYESGVFDGCNQTYPDLDHAVLLVGYGTDPAAGDYWIIRNSWSATWGEGGYIRIRRQHSPLRCGLDVAPAEGVACKGDPPEQTVCGTCGVWVDSSYPVAGTPHLF